MPHRVLLLLLLITLMGCSSDSAAKPQPPNPAPSKRAMDRVDGIRAKLMKGELSRTDREYLLKATRSETLVTRRLAFLCLVIAADKNLFSQDELRTILIEQISRSSGPGAIGLLMDYQSLIKMPVSRTGTPNDVDNFNTHAIGPEEQRRIRAYLAEPKEKDRFGAAAILVSKERLEPGSLIYANSVVEAELARATGKGKELWRFVKECLEKKN